MRLRLATAVAAVALASTGPSALAAEIPHDNLTRNASFEVGTTDWKPGHASVRRLAVSGAPHGSFAAEVSRGQQPRYVLTDQPDTVAATEAGAEYFIEVGHPATENEFATITAPQIRSAVWHSLIAGARGIQYFNHSFGGPCISFNVLREPCGATVRPAVKALNEQITSLAPVLNAPTVEGGWVQGPDTRTMVKWHDGHLYVFMGAAGVGGTSTFTLDCVGDATATVLDEARSVPVVGGTFHDTFSDADAVHLYRIDGASSCGLS